MRKDFFFWLVLLLWSCGPDPIPAPGASILIAPANLNECTTATAINDLERQVRFEWTSALNTDNYELIIENSLTNKRYSKATSLLTESITLPGGAPYCWYVNSYSLLSSEVSESQVWQFYLEGNTESTFFPFPAVLIAPENEAILTLDTDASLTFLWEGHDLDQDIDRYDFYIGRTSDNLVKEKEGLSNSQTTINLEPGTTYFWQVVTIDDESNASKSEIFRFQTEN